MKNIAILSIAGLAAAATAQSVTLHFDIDGDPLGGQDVVADSASWTVYASFTGYSDPAAYFGGFVGSFDASGDGAASNLQNLMAGEGTAATANGASIETINIFHSALLQTNDPANPIAIFSFDTSGTTSELSYSASGLASVFADGGLFSLPDEFTSVNIISDRLVIPAPGAAAVLGLGGLVATRRRR
jgi:hypothetical protein